MARHQSTESCDQGTVLQASKGFDSTAAIQIKPAFTSSTGCHFTQHLLITKLASWIFNGTFHIINQLELVGDVAVPVSVRQAVLFCALRSHDASPRLNWRRSSNTVLSQVCLGRPGRRLQFLGVDDIQDCRARE